MAREFIKKIKTELTKQEIELIKYYLIEDLKKFNKGLTEAKKELGFSYQEWCEKQIRKREILLKKLKGE